MKDLKNMTTQQVQALAESGEATRMIDDLVKANPEMAERGAAIREEMQAQRAKALYVENKDRFKIVFHKSTDEMNSLKDNTSARNNRIIELVEKDKIENPNHTQTFEDYSEEEKKKRLEKIVEESYYRAHPGKDQTSSGKEEGNNLFAAALAVGVIACFAGAPSLALGAFAMAAMLEEFEGASKGLEGSKGTLKETTLEDFRANFIKNAKDQGKTDIVNTLSR